MCIVAIYNVLLLLLLYTKLSSITCCARSNLLTDKRATGRFKSESMSK